MVPTKVIIDLDGTLSKYPGSDFRSLFSKYIELNKGALENTAAAKFSAEIMVNRYSKDEITRIRGNLEFLRNEYGSLLILSLNYRIVAIKYLEELRILHLFNVDNSKFREDLSDEPRKESVWPDLMKLYQNIIYIDDDDDTIKSLGALPESKTVKFVHMKNMWMGDCDIKELIE